LREAAWIGTRLELDALDLSLVGEVEQRVHAADVNAYLFEVDWLFQFGRRNHQGVLDLRETDLLAVLRIVGIVQEVFQGHRRCPPHSMTLKIVDTGSVRGIERP
jgi:hypothetical protein